LDGKGPFKDIEMAMWSCDDRTHGRHQLLKTGAEELDLGQTRAAGAAIHPDAHR
jgi:hypothetical protein